ncbi:TIGR03619 family F420-dependent LLM class oxidoreductase [Frankia sp. Cppng1_Ct_nod]|uniref:LLM class flavin-dependent oxidoreductase n=1 Tax=Frankia sp. Cppng1_Ct_nod TaxID=2897162 RepID=UPI0010414488|nr:TIGR03619 family F420-dependent LLM class oxidoreductase [Frankia sp. Cppng1_Ct_nod]
MRRTAGTDAPAGGIEQGVLFGFNARGEKEEIQRLDNLGIDSLWASGHIAAPLPTPEALVTLGLLAALTDRPRIGTAVLLLPLYPPAIVAKQVAAIDRVSGGRVTLGVGVGGEYPQEFDACGVPVAGRGHRVDEQIRVLRDLWTGEKVDGAGPHYPFRGIRISPSPAQPGGPPIAIAGTKAPAMRRAATLGNGWMPYLLSADRYAQTVRTVREQAAAIGRDLDGFEWFQFLFVSVADRTEDAYEEMARMFGSVWSRDLRGLVERVTAAGTPEQVATRVQAYVDAGARHVIFQPAGDDVTASLRNAERVAREVLPLVTAPKRVEATSDADR